MAPRKKASAAPRTPQLTESGERRLLSVQEVAAKLGVTERWVRRAVGERTIPFIKLGGRRLLRFDPVVIDAWVERQHVPAER